MEECIKKLEDMLNAKKKTASSQDEEKYSAAWMDLIKKEGSFSPIAEKYFYKGFFFMGAKPFVTWVLESKKPDESLDAMINGKLFGKDTTLTFRILVSVLANLLMAKVKDVNLILSIIKKIPLHSKNKENKIIGDAHKIFSKYYIDKIDHTVKYPSLKEYNLNNDSINEFVTLMDELVGRFDFAKLTKKQKMLINKIETWLHPEEQKTEDNTPNEESNKNLANIKDHLDSATNIHTDLVEEEKTNDHCKEPADLFEQAWSLIEKAKTSLKSQHDEISQKIASLVKQLSERDSQISSMNNKIHELEQTTEKLKADLTSKESQISDQNNTNNSLKSQLEETSQKIASLGKQLSERDSQISSMNGKIHELEQNTETLNADLKSKKNTISDQQKMIEALHSDKAKQSDAVPKRLASALNDDYRDFMSAQEQDMTIDLGNNFRSQLKAIFNILKKSGITFK